MALLVFLASMVGAFSGFGTSTIMVPVMLLFYPLPVTLLFVGIIHWFGDIWKMVFFRTGVRKWRLIIWFAIPGIAASYFGALMSLRVDEMLLTRILGGFLLSYVVFIVIKSEWSLPEHKLSVGVGGLASGFSAGIFGVGGAIRGAFLTAFDLPKEVYLFTSGAMAFVIDSARILGYLLGGTRLEGSFLWGLLIYIPISLFGAWTASHIVRRVPQERFRFLIAIFLSVIAIKFLLFP